MLLISSAFARVSSKESKRHGLQKNIKVVSREKKSQIYLIILTEAAIIIERCGKMH